MESINATPKSERIHIGIFGRRNAGKSSLINALTGQSLAVVSDVAGTTTDPVEKAMELLPLGPVVIIDTPGLDDVGELGAMRVEKARTALEKTDIALIVTDAGQGMGECEQEIESQIKAKNIPYMVVYNKSDLHKKGTGIEVSAKTGEGIKALKEKLANILPNKEDSRCIIADLIAPGDTVVLVVPIDSAAPKGRLILPQQQTIRDILERGAMAMVCRDTELAITLSALDKPPKMVVTDSQAFAKVKEIVPEDILLTSFSILFARYKGDLERLVKSVTAVNKIADGDKLLISEGCTHHRQCEDIGSVKIPRLLKAYTGKEIEFCFTSGGEFPKTLSGYSMVIHCGGCMLNEREMKSRIERAGEQDVPIVNYGVLLAYLNGILERSLEPFPEILKLITK